MSQEPKKMDRRKFIYAGIGAAVIIVGGAAVYFATKPPEVTTITSTVPTTTTATSTTTVPTTTTATTTATSTTTATQTSTTTSTLTTTSTAAVKKITWWTVVNEGKMVSGQKIGASPDFENAAIKEFTGQNPNIGVDVVAIPWGDLFTKYVTALEAGVGPDVLFIPTTWAPQFIYAGYCKDLESFKSELDINDFSSAALNLFSAEGKLYGIPMRVDSRLLTYNVDLLKQAGYDRPPAYWPDEVLEWSKALTKAEIGQYGTGVVGRQTDSIIYDFWLCWAITNGGSILSKDMKECVLNSPEAVEALQFYCDLLNKYKVAPPGALDYDKAALRMMFIPGKIAMYSDGMFAATDFAKTPALKYAFDLIPGTKKIKSGQILGGWASLINSKTKYEEEAWKLVKFLADPKWMATWALSSPARYSAASFGGYFDNEGAKKNWEGALFGTPLPMHPKTGKIIPIIAQGVAEAVGQKKTPSEAMGWITTEVNKLIKT